MPRSRQDVSLGRSSQLFEMADAQAGYFTTGQAEQVGFSRRVQHHYTQTGEWLHIHQGLYRLRLYPTTDADDLVRLTLWSRDRAGQPQAVVSHDTALALYDLSDHDPARLHLTVPRRFRKPAPDGVVLHKADLSPGDVRSQGAYRVTTPQRTLLDLAGTDLSPEHLGSAVQQAVARGLVRRRALDAALPELGPSARQRLANALTRIGMGSG